MTKPALQALLRGGTLAGEWVLDPHKSSIRLKSRSMWGLAPVTGVFREITGTGAVAADGTASGTITVGRSVHRHETRPARYAPALG